MNIYKIFYWLVRGYVKDSRGPTNQTRYLVLFTIDKQVLQ